VEAVVPFHHSFQLRVADGEPVELKGLDRLVRVCLFREAVDAPVDDFRLALVQLELGGFEHVEVHPRATDISPDLPHSGVLGVAMVNLDGGGVMHVYSGPNGYGTKSARTFVACRVTHDAGRTWGPEQVITRHDDRNASHPTVMRSADGSLHVFYLGYNTWGWTKDGEPDDCDSPIWTIRSLDGGKTWMDRVKVFEGYSGATNGAIQTRTGRLLVPFSHYVSKPGRLQSSVGVSDDGGLTWRTTGLIDIGGAGHHSGALEPSVLELRDGRIWMLIRTERKFFMIASFSSSGQRM